MLAFLLIPWVFYLITAVMIISMIALIENDELGWSHALFVAFVCLMAYKSGINLKEIIMNPMTIFKYLSLYLGIGVVWAFCKWYFFLKNVLANFTAYKEKTKKELQGYTQDALTKAMNDRIKSAIKNSWNGNGLKELSCEEDSSGQLVILPPQANNNKARITTWITHWPFSMVWTLLNDPIKKLANYIVEVLKSWFQKISDRIFQNSLNIK